MENLYKKLLPAAAVALLSLAGLSACADKPRELREQREAGELGQPLSGATVSVITPDFFGLGEDLAHQLVGNFRLKESPAGTRLILTSLVDLDQLEETSRFGRTISEALATQLFRRGFQVEEVRKAEALMIKNPDGELLLSRDAALLAREQQAHAVVTGTYALTPGTVIVNVRLLDAASRSVLSVAGLEIERSPAINHMLAAGTGPGLRDGALSGRER